LYIGGDWPLVKFDSQIGEPRANVCTVQFRGVNLQDCWLRLLNKKCRLLNSISRNCPWNSETKVDWEGDSSGLSCRWVVNLQLVNFGFSAWRAKSKWLGSFQVRV
jgi:hypothetical protein